jgi:predicted DNA-binding transcriptional regulator AlpA
MHPELVGIPEIAELLHLSRQRTDQLSRQDGFPRPVGVLRLSRRRVWRETDVRAWSEARTRTPPPPVS